MFGDAWPYSKAKTALLKAAATVIRERGPRAATLKNVAAKAGVTEPAIFRHFDGVDGLFESMFTVAELFRRRFVELFAEGGSSGLGRLESAFVACLQAAKDYPEYASLLAAPDPTFRQYEELVPQLSATDAALASAVAGCFKEAKAAGQLAAGAEPEALANAALGSFGLILERWAKDTAGYDPVKEGKKAVGLLAGLCRKPGSEAAQASAKGARPKRR